MGDIKLGSQYKIRSLESRVEELSEALRISASTDPHEPNPTKAGSGEWGPIFLTRATRNKNLSPSLQQRNLALSFDLYRTNPIAHRIVNIFTSFVVGGGATIITDNKVAQEAINDFWFDPVNRWDINLIRKVRDLSIYGEICLQMFPNLTTGQVRQRFIQSDLIHVILHDPNNPDRLEKIVLALSKNSDENETIPLSRENFDLDKAIQLDVIKPGEGTDQGKIIGDTFYYGLNLTSDSDRGVGDLFPILDWLDFYDRVLFDRTEKLSQLGMYVWDRKLIGANDKTIATYVEKARKSPIRPGSTIYHNEKEEIAAIVPDVKSRDTQVELQMIQNHILSAAGIPRHWLSDGGGSGSLASEMAEPTIRCLEERQMFVRNMLTDIVNYVLAIKGAYYLKHRARKSSEISQIIDGEVKFDIQLPSISDRSLTRGGSALNNMSQALRGFKEDGVITDKEYRKIVRALMGQMYPDMLGLPMTTDTENV